MFGKDYVLRDYKNDYYWVKNKHFGYNWQNKEVLEATFTDKLEEATQVTWEEVRDIIEKFEDGTLIAGGRFKPDIKSLGRYSFMFVSEEDMKYLRGTPAPLKITVPVEIEEDDEQDS